MENKILAVDSDFLMLFNFPLIRGNPETVLSEPWSLVMTQKMLDLLHYRFPSVTSWRNLMLDLETYLVRRPDKEPKDFKKFVLNCAKRHAEDVKKGLRFADGKVNLKAFADRAPERPEREESLTQTALVQKTNSLRAKLATLERGTPEYEKILAQLRRPKQEQMLLSFGEIMERIAAAVAPTDKGRS